VEVEIIGIKNNRLNLKCKRFAHYTKD
jgi:hypothetical protein